MKKTIGLLLAIAMLCSTLLCFAGCGSTEKKPENEKGLDLFRDGVLLVEVDGKYGYIDKTGSYVLNPIYDDVTDFSSYYADSDYDKEQTLWVDIEKDGKMGFFHRATHARHNLTMLVPFPVTVLHT